MTCPHDSISLAGLDAKQGIQFWTRFAIQ